jgi:hypothetical protein
VGSSDDCRIADSFQPVEFAILVLCLVAIYCFRRLVAVFVIAIRRHPVLRRGDRDYVPQWIVRIRRRDVGSGLAGRYRWRYGLATA